MSAVHGQESGHGRADTSKPNYAGAIGEMQIIKSTFDGMKRLGLIPQDADFNNPNHSKRAGEIHAEYLFDKYQGDTRKAAAAYYSGEGVVRRDGSIGDYRDPKNAKAPTTHQYVSQIQSRLGNG